MVWSNFPLKVSRLKIGWLVIPRILRMRPGSVGSGMGGSLRIAAETLLISVEGIMLPGKGVRLYTPFPRLAVVCGPRWAVGRRGNWPGFWRREVRRGNR